ncbi:MAG: hypothetical protein MUO72_17555 [Bacteroidales bacterium]|nr:hypothetical protein [Bacteroidales bacterium]
MLKGNLCCFAEIPLLSACYGEIAPIPKFVHDFIEKYQDRIVYGTDMTFNASIFRIIFRILETNDEHFYETYMFDFHWPLYGLALSPLKVAKIQFVNNQIFVNKFM